MVLGKLITLCQYNRDISRSYASSTAALKIK